MSIKLKTDNISVTFEGRIKSIPSKRGYKTSTSVYGEDLNEYTRGVINLTINIEKIEEEEYQKLVDLFFDYNNSINIEDRGRGKLFRNYYIVGKSVSLLEKEDLANKTYYHTGSITMNRR